jgi:hypothetical protein
MKFLLIAALLFASAPAIANEGTEPDDFGDFSVSFRAAHDSADIRKISELVCWDRVDARTRASLERHTASEFGRSISSIEFEGIPESEMLEYEQGGVIYRPNLSPLGFIVVRYAANPSNPTAATESRFLLGRQAGELRITTAAPSVGQ